MAEKSKGNGGKLALVAAIGAAAGFVTGILTAPKSGKETREDIKNTAAKFAREAEKKLKQLYNDLSDLIDKGTAELQKRGGQAKAGLDKAVESAKVTRDKVKEVITAIRNGEADHPELEKAIKDATKAKEHLAKFFKQ